MTPKEFRDAARRLYGLDWRQPLALRLRLSPVTVWRYANGLSPVPHTVELALKFLLEEGGQ